MKQESGTPGLSLRAKVLLIVVLGALLPMSLVALWWSNDVRRSGEAILHSRLDSTLTVAARDIGETWISRRSSLLSIADDEAVRVMLGGRDHAQRIPLPRIASSFSDLRGATEMVLIRDIEAPRAVLAADSSGLPLLIPAAESLSVGSGRTDVIRISMPVMSIVGDSVLGWVEARLKSGALTSSLSADAALAGSVMVIVDRTTGAVVVPLPFDLVRMRQGRFTWAGEEWLAVSRTVEDPAIELLVAAPITPYTAPFEAAGRKGITALALVTLLGLGVTLLLTQRVTRSLVQLADAADKVTGGDLTPRVELTTRDEVGRVARAFNGMIDSVRQMLRERSEREAVAAVGEFATSLAHEIRNPLSAVRLNLQHLQERLPDDAGSHASVELALANIDRLNRTVAGVLRMARSGRLPMERLDLRDPLVAAVRDALPAFDAKGVMLVPLSVPERLEISGNAAALEQLVLNLLLNAAQATPAGARAGIRADVQGDQVVVTVWDEGVGFDETGLRKAFDPFFSTKPEGTGLGLTLAQRIAAAHGGSVSIESVRQHGTRVHVVIPRSA